MENVLELLLQQATIAPSKPAIIWWNAGAWQTATWLQLATDASRLARGLQSAGLQPGERVAILAENSYRWVLLDFALQASRAVSVPLHPQLSAEQIAGQLGHSGSTWVGVSTPQLLAKIKSRLSDLGLDPQRILPFEFRLPWASAVDRQIQLSSALEHPGAATDLEWLRFAAQQIQPEDLLTVLYTSGTTGDPKGVMLTHRNILANARAKCATLPLGPDDVRICWLPLSHVFARVCDLVTGLLAGCQTVISRGREQLFAECRQFQPTYLNGVPYFFERCYRHLQQHQRLGDRTALRELLGGRIRLCNSGGAPLADHLFDYFRESGIGLVTGYGLTEAAPVVTSNRPETWRRSSVGQAIPGVEVRIAADGEVLVRGPNVMSGYYRNEPATHRTLREGWLHTGDLGELDADGFLFLSGRKDDLIVLNTARKVHPAELENLILSSPLIQQCCLFGRGRNFLIALLTIDRESLRRMAVETCIAPDGPNWEQPLVQQELNRLLKNRAAHEQVGAWLPTSQPFSSENGLLTAKQSLRRQQIGAAYAAAIEQAYEDCKSNRADQPDPDLLKLAGVEDPGADQDQVN